MSGLVALLLAASVGPVAFKMPGAFVVTTRDGVFIERVSSIADKVPESLTYSPDGLTMVFTAYDTVAEQPLLFRLGKKDLTPSLLGRPTGYHAQPSFTNDGKWIFFVHHPDRSGGAPGRHGARAYGQIWKVRLDGSGLEQVTSSEGCKLYPDVRSETAAIFTHADCNKASAIESLTAGKLMVMSPMSGFRSHLPRISNDGAAVVFVRLANQQVSVVRVVAKKKEEILAVFDTPEQPAELVWSTGGDVLLQLGAVLYKISSSGGAVQLLDLSGVLK